MSTRDRPLLSIRTGSTSPSLPLPALGVPRSWMSRPEPSGVEMQSDDGQVLEGRDDPRGSFPEFTDTVQWDAVQVAYFTSAAT
jgi:hypothetical protein